MRKDEIIEDVSKRISILLSMKLSSSLIGCLIIRLNGRK